MSEKLDNFYVQLRNLTEQRLAATEKVKADQDLSESGRHSRLREIESEFGPKYSELEARFNKHIGEEASGHKQYLNGKGKRTSYAERLKAKARTNESVISDTVNDTIEAAAMVEAVEALQETISKSTFLNVIGSLDAEKFNSVYASVRDSGDEKKLSWIQDLYNMRGDGNLSNSVSAEIEKIQDEKDPARALAKKRLQNSELQKQYFDYSLAASREQNKYSDVRGQETEIQLQQEIQHLTEKIKQSGQAT